MGVRIMIDPGHVKGYNAGVTPGYYEGNAMYNYGVYLKKELEAYDGFTVFITREDIEENPSLESRGTMASNRKCDLFLSLHSNAYSPSSAACGVSGFYSVKRPGSKALGNRILNAIVDLMKKDTKITYSRGMTTRAYSTQSPNLDYYGVIRASVNGVSSVEYSYLIEHGFHTNPTECAWLSKDANIRKLAAVVAQTIANYFGVKLKGASGNIAGTLDPDSGKLYKVLTVINGYKTAADAMAKTNPVSTPITPGTYVIYRTYTNGAINITTDKSGQYPGSWINPNENISPIKEYDVVEDILGYGTSADAMNHTNPKTTIVAKKYYVFRKNNGMINVTTDSSANIPGAWINPKDNVKKPKLTPEEQMAKIDTSSLTKISMDSTNVPVVTFDKAVSFLKKKNNTPKINCSVEQLVYWYMKAGFEEDVRWDIGFAQSCLETGYFNFGAQVDPAQNNFAGIGALNGGASGASFDTPYEGILAQIQHLKAYASTDNCSKTCVDPRFGLVSRGWSPYVEWLGMKDNPKNDIYGKETGWAVPGNGYGKSILKILDEIMKG